MRTLGLPILPLTGLVALAVGVTVALNAADANPSVVAVALIGLAFIGGMLAMPRLPR